MTTYLYPFDLAVQSQVKAINEITECNENDIDLILNKHKQLQGKIGVKQYLMSRMIDRSPLVHLKDCKRLKNMMKTETLGTLWKELILYIPLHFLYQLEDPDLFTFIENHTSLSRFTFYTEVYKRCKQLYIPTYPGHIQEFILTRSETYTFFFSTGMDYSCPIASFMKCEIAMLQYFSEINLFHSDKMIRELSSRMLHNLEVFLSESSALYASLVLRSIQLIFQSIQTPMSKYIAQDCKNLAQIWMDDSVLTDIIGYLCEETEWTREELLQLLLWSLSEIQLHQLYCILESILKLTDETNYRLYTRFDKIVIRRVKQNVNLILERLSKFLLSNCSVSLIDNPLYYCLDDELIQEYKKPHLSQQGINELYFRERMKCNMTPEYIYEKMKILEFNHEIIAKEIKELHYKEKNPIRQDYTSISSFHPSSLYCINCKQDYDKICNEVEKCKHTHSKESNQLKLKTIQSCMQKRIAFKHTCQRNIDKGHDKAIQDLVRSSETCKGLIQ